MNAVNLFVIQIVQNVSTTRTTRQTPIHCKDFILLVSYENSLFLTHFKDFVRPVI